MNKREIKELLAQAELFEQEMLAGLALQVELPDFLSRKPMALLKALMDYIGDEEGYPLVATIIDALVPDFALHMCAQVCNPEHLKGYDERQLKLAEKVFQGVNLMIIHQMLEEQHPNATVITELFEDGDTVNPDTGAAVVQLRIDENGEPYLHRYELDENGEVVEKD